MAEETPASNLWLSTYGIVTVERVLGHYKMVISHDNLVSALKKPTTFIYKLVQLPLTSVLTGIIRQQAYDLQVYGQKLFVDYLLSGETVKPESSPGGLTRSELESTRLELVASSKAFHELEYEHNKQIASCQHLIVQSIKKWQKIFKKVVQDIYQFGKKHQIKWSKNQVESLINILLCNLPIESIDKDPKQVQEFISKPNIDVDFQSELETFCRFLTPLKEESLTLITKMKELENDAISIQQQMRHFRQKFKDCIITSIELFGNLPEYAVDPEQDKINRELIDLDSNVTESLPESKSKSRTET